MTFTEAALEVLRSAGEPLHYKKITELAIAGNLLSHVGKTPEVTMSSRLATLVKKDWGQSPIIKVRPGVFALREATMHTDKEASNPPASEEPGPTESEANAAPAERPAMPGADVFPEEADDDFPILAGLEEEAAAGEDRGRRRRRRRRRGGKGGADLAAPEGAGQPGGGERRNGAREPMRHEREPMRHEREPVRHEREPMRHEREPMRHEREARREREPMRREREREPMQPELDFSRQPAEGDLLGKDLADAAYHVLSRGDRSPASFARVADLLVRKGRLSGSPDALAPTVAAALRADAARADRAHGRPRFRIAGQRVSLSEWLLPREAVRSSEAVEHNAEAQRDQVRRAFVGRLNDLPAAGFAELVATWLNAEGVTALRAVRRPGSSGREFHFAGTLRRGAEENRLAFVVLRAGRDLDREAVIEARGSLHHYGSASGAWLVTTGRIHGAAREEAAAEGAAPCALFGGADLARAMERLGIGLREHYVPLCDIDFDLLESLGDSGQARREREDGPRERHERQPRARGRGGPQGGADRGAPARPETGEEGETEPAAAAPDQADPLDLLDPEAAEASRLVVERDPWDAPGENGEDELEGRPTLRAAGEVTLDDEAEDAAGAAPTTGAPSGDGDADDGDSRKRPRSRRRSQLNEPAGVPRQGARAATRERSDPRGSVGPVGPRDPEEDGKSRGFCSSRLPVESYEAPFLDGSCLGIPKASSSDSAPSVGVSLPSSTAASSPGARF